MIEVCSCFAALSPAERSLFYDTAFLNGDNDAGCTFAGAAPGELFEMCAQRGVMSTPSTAAVDDGPATWCDLACEWAAIGDPGTAAWPISYGTGVSTPMALTGVCALRLGFRHPHLGAVFVVVAVL